MKFNLVSFFGMPLVGLLIIGCSSSTNNIKISKPKSLILEQDKAKASVVFTTMKAFPLQSWHAKIMEFNPKTFVPTYLGTFDEMQTFIHQVNPGEHYYFIDPLGVKNPLITPKRIVAIKAKAGETIHVNSLFASVMPESRKTIISNISHSECTPNDLKRYGFFTDTEKNSQLDSELLSFQIKCDNKKVIDIVDTRQMTFDDIEKAMLVAPSEDDLKKFNVKQDANKYQTEIQELFPILVDEHKNIFQHYNHKMRWSEMYSIDIQEATADENANRFEYIILSDLNDVGNIEKKFVDTFNNHIINNIAKAPSGSSNAVMIKYEIENYIDGNQATRYFGLTDSQRIAGMSSLLLNVSFIDVRTGATIGKIKYASILFGGVFGGTIGLLSDASNHISEYAKMNYLK